MTRPSNYSFQFMVATEFQPAVLKRASGAIFAINGCEKCRKSLVEQARSGLARGEEMVA